MIKIKRWIKKRLSFKRPNNVIWSWPQDSFAFGWSIQRYSYNARAVTICIGILTLRWHDR